MARYYIPTQFPNFSAYSIVPALQVANQTGANIYKMRRQNALDRRAVEEQQQEQERQNAMRDIFARNVGKEGFNRENAIADLYRGGFPEKAMELEGDIGDSPSSVQEFLYLQKRFPNRKWNYQDYLDMKRQNYGLKEIAGVANLIRKGPQPQVQPLTTIEKEVQGQARIAGGKAQAREMGKSEAEKITGQGKAQTRLAASREKTDFLNNTIDQAIDQVGLLTAGPGATTKWIPGSPAKDLSATLDTIRANIGFDRLQEMRDSSPTGGALGQVSEMENKLLQAVWGSLEQSQSPEQLIENLKKAKTAIRKSWERVAAAYEQDYGKPMPMEGTPLDTGKKSTIPAGTIKKIGGKVYVKTKEGWFEQ